MFLGLIATVLIVVVIIIYRRGGLKHSFANTLGAARSSSNAKWLAVVTLVAIVTGLIIWQWDALVALHSSVVSPNFPMWGYAVGIALIIAAIWLFRMDKEKRERASTLAEWLIGFVAIGGALVVFNNWEGGALCPDKQAYISVPAQGMVVDLQSCWDEEFVQLDLREVGVTELSFNTPAKVLEGRTIREFAYLVTGAPGLINGHARLVFNSSEMRKYGVTTLPVFVGPARTESRVDVEGLAKLAQ